MKLYWVRVPSCWQWGGCRGGLREKKKNHRTESGAGNKNSEKQQREHQAQKRGGGPLGAGAEIPLQPAPGGDHPRWSRYFPAPHQGRLLKGTADRGKDPCRRNGKV